MRFARGGTERPVADGLPVGVRFLIIVDGAVDVEDVFTLGQVAAIDDLFVQSEQSGQLTHGQLIWVYELSAVLGDEPILEVVTQRPATPPGATLIGLVDGRGERFLRVGRPQRVRTAQASEARSDDRD